MCYKHTGPHLENDHTTENRAYAYSHAKLGIYQSECEVLRTNPQRVRTWCMLDFKLGDRNTAKHVRAVMNL